MNVYELLIYLLDVWYYIDLVYFEWEKIGLLVWIWQFVGYVLQFEKFGDYFIVEIVGESFICLKDCLGDLWVYYNVCQYWVYQLVQGEGNIKLFVCFYYSWIYEFIGGLWFGLNVKFVLGFDCSQICLSFVCIEDFCGFFFVNFDLDVKVMDDWFLNVWDELRFFVLYID